MLMEGSSVPGTAFGAIRVLMWVATNLRSGCCASGCSGDPDTVDRLARPFVNRLHRSLVADPAGPLIGTCFASLGMDAAEFRPVFATIGATRVRS